MTREEAIKVLKRDLAIQKENKCLPDGIEAIEIAITALQISIENDGVQKVLNDIFCNDNGLNPPEPIVPISCSGKPNECEDAVNRKIDEWEVKGKSAELWLINGMLQIRVLGTIHNVLLPSVTPKQKTGKWIDKGQCVEDHSEHEYTCSSCGSHVIEDQSYIYESNPHCKWCGAKMEEGE